MSDMAAESASPKKNPRKTTATKAPKPAKAQKKAAASKKMAKAATASKITAQERPVKKPAKKPTATKAPAAKKVAKKAKAERKVVKKTEAKKPTAKKAPAAKKAVTKGKAAKKVVTKDKAAKKVVTKDKAAKKVVTKAKATKKGVAKAPAAKKAVTKAKATKTAKKAAPKKSVGDKKSGAKKAPASKAKAEKKALAPSKPAARKLGKAQSESSSSKTESTVLDLEAELAGLPEDSGETIPDMPVGMMLLEATDVATAALGHQAKLATLPFDHSLVLKLPLYVEALTQAESAWRRARVQGTDRAFAADRKEAEALRSDILASGRYLLRRDSAAQAELDLIAAGDGLPDLVEDLALLGEFVTRHAADLAPAGFKGGTEAAAARATTLGRTLTEHAARERQDQSAAQALARRNQLFALVKDAVSEIRAAARFALRKTPEELGPYRTSYYVSKKRKARKAAGEAASSAQVGPETSPAVS